MLRLWASPHACPAPCMWLPCFFPYQVPCPAWEVHLGVSHSCRTGVRALALPEQAVRAAGMRVHGKAAMALRLHAQQQQGGACGAGCRAPAALFLHPLCWAVMTGKGTTAAAPPPMLINACAGVADREQGCHPCSRLLEAEGLCDVDQHRWWCSSCAFCQAASAELPGDSKAGIHARESVPLGVCMHGKLKQVSGLSRSRTSDAEHWPYLTSFSSRKPERAPWGHALGGWVGGWLGGWVGGSVGRWVVGCQWG